ncbi:4503_t:CDS:2, partial [Acaulospora colombiana]
MPKKKGLFKIKRNKQDSEPYPSLGKVPFTLKDVEIDCPHRIDTGSPDRNRAVKLIYNALIKAVPGANNVRKIDILVLASSIEHNIFRNYRCIIDRHYKDRIRSRVYNLADEKNPDFVKKVISGEIRPEKLAIMTTEDMASSEIKRKKAIELKKRVQQIIRREPDLVPLKLEGDGSLG